MQKTGDKRVFGLLEMWFDILYLLTSFVMGCIMLSRATSGIVFLAGIMAIVLSLGDSFHLLPRIAVIVTGNEPKYHAPLGIGKQITSITMTIYYVLLWHIGLIRFSLAVDFLWTFLVYLLAGIRIVLCLFPQNEWLKQRPSVKWGIIRNIPFLLLGIIVAMLFFIYGQADSIMRFMGFAISISFLCYLPVVIFSDKNPKIGMLMLPKTCAYVWMIIMCFRI